MNNSMSFYVKFLTKTHFHIATRIPKNHTRIISILKNFHFIKKFQKFISFLLRQILNIVIQYTEKRGHTELCTYVRKNNIEMDNICYLLVNKMRGKCLFNSKIKWMAFLISRYIRDFLFLSHMKQT